MIKLSTHKGWWISSSDRLKKMHKINPHCMWCGRRTRLFKRYKMYMPNRGATADHLYSRNDIRRKKFKEKHITSPIVLSCYRCNQERGDMLYEEFCKIKNVEVDFNFVYY